MRFQIAGRQHDVERRDIETATRNSTPTSTDGRHRYFVGLHNRQYPVKQVIQLATGLASHEFTSQYALGILTRLGFDVQDRLSSPAAFVDGDGQGPRLLVTFESDEDGWIVASCPTLPGCHSQGRTRKQALANIREALRGYLASMREHGVPLPVSSDFELVDVTA